MTIQADGKIVAAGVSGMVGMFRRDPKVALARYNADGSLDTSFGADGRVTTNFTGTDDRAQAVTTQVDGKILVAGSAGAYKGFAIVRYIPNGSRDPSFGEEGKITTRFKPRGSGQFAAAITVQADAKIVAVGAETSGAGFALARYKMSGALDRSFGGDGKVTTSFLTRLDRGYVGGWARGVVIQADGKIIVAGGSAVSSGGDTEFALARYNVDGTLDLEFGDDGKVTTVCTVDDNDSAFAVAIQADGKIIAAGTAAYFGPEATFALARYLSA